MAGKDNVEVMRMRASRRLRLNVQRDSDNRVCKTVELCTSPGSRERETGSNVNISTPREHVSCIRS